MTSRSILGGNEQSIGSLHREQVRSSQFQTYASAAYEPDANVSPPATSSLLANLVGSSDPFIRAPFEGSKILQTLIDIGVVAFWVGLSLLCMLASIGAFFALLLVKF